MIQHTFFLAQIVNDTAADDQPQRISALPQCVAGLAQDSGQRHSGKVQDQ